MRSRFFDGKNVSLIASIASFVCAGVSLIGALLCLIGKKKTTATIFAALSGIAAAVGAVTAYTLRLAEESSALIHMITMRTIRMTRMRTMSLT